MLRAWFRNWLGPTLLLTSTAKAMTEPTPTKAAAVHPPRSARRDLVAVIGCTGTGKSKLAVELAQHVQQTTLLAAATTTITGSVYADAEVISADSMQVYRGMDVISNKATAEEMGGVSHHLMSFLPAGTEYTIKDFISQARGLIGRMHQAERPVLPVLRVGLPTTSSICSFLATCSPTAGTTLPRTTSRPCPTRQSSGRRACLKTCRPPGPTSSRRLDSVRRIRKLQIINSVRAATSPPSYGPSFRPSTRPWQHDGTPTTTARSSEV